MHLLGEKEQSQNLNSVAIQNVSNIWGLLVPKQSELFEAWHFDSLGRHFLKKCKCDKSVINKKIIWKFNLKGFPGN